ncbi:MAG: hypothetical protein GQ569_04065 [Methylococcaceae bacterium]|nr:hypothetical protein [Methylococcaceae bacterium]
MQITIELNNQHLETLHEQEEKLKKIFPQKKEQTEGEKAYQLMLQSGFIGCVESNENLSENYKEHLDWNHKI